jgi:monofunctional glycosyltransferase
MAKASRLASSSNVVGARRRWTLWRFIKWIVALALLLVLLIQLSYAVRIWWWRDHNPSMTAFMQDGLDRIQEKQPNAQLKHQWVKYDQINENLKRAVIVAEDAKFGEHDGFDWDAIERALEKNEKRGKVVGGGSTISQQLAKNLFLTGSRSKIRKAQEGVITLMLENILDKERILDIYLNVIEWGDGVYGAEAAARHYYRKSAASLTAGEASRLAAMVPRPRFYDKNRGSTYLSKKAGWVQRQLHLVELP